MSVDFTGKRLLVLGGMRLSCEIIRKAQTMGLTVIVADYYPVEKSPGKQIADESYEVSTIDVNAVVDLIRAQQIDGVITGYNDMMLPYYAEICRKAGLPAYGTKEQFELFTDKAKYKQLCRQFGVPTVEEYHIDETSFDDTAVKYPVLVKPSDNSGSRGVFVCSNSDELKHAMRTARSYSKENSILVERYLTGREVTVFWLFVDGECYLTAIGNRHVKQNQGADVIPLPVGYTFPSSITSRYRREVEEKAKAMFRHAGIKNGMMFMQCKVEDGVCVVYDIGYRLTGSLEYINLAQVCGFNPLEMMIRFAITGSMCEKDVLKRVTPESMKPSYNVSILAKPGTIGRIEGIDAVKAFPNVADVVVEHYPGEIITEGMRGLLAQVTVRAFGSVEEPSQLYAAMHSIENTIRIISTEGQLMNLPGIEPEDLEGLLL